MAPAERRAARRVMLVDAAFDLLGTQGLAGTTVRKVCEAAQLNPRYFYESFDDLDSLLLAVFDHVLAEGARAEPLLPPPAPGDDVTDRTRASISRSIRFLTDDPRRVRVLFVEGLSNEKLMQRRLDTVRAIAAEIDADARRIYGPPAPGERIGVLASNLLAGGITELLVMWLDGRLELTVEQLIDDLTDLTVAVGREAVEIARRRGHARGRSRTR